MISWSQAIAFKWVNLYCLQRGIPFESRRVIVVASPTGGAADAAAVGTTVTVTAGVAKNAPSDPMPTEYVDPGGALQVENSVYPSLESAWFQLESAWFQPLSL